MGKIQDYIRGIWRGFRRRMDDMSYTGSLREAVSLCHRGRVPDLDVFVSHYGRTPRQVRDDFEHLLRFHHRDWCELMDVKENGFREFQYTLDIPDEPSPGNIRTVRIDG